MGIPLSSNFDVGSAIPLDARAVATDNIHRNSIPAGSRYEGLVVYVLAGATNFQLQGGTADSDWVDISGGGVASGSQVSKIADNDLGGHRVVIATQTGVDYADSSNQSHVDLVLGVTNNAAIATDSVNITTNGELVEPSWSWALGNVYVGVGGILTQTAPTIGFIQVIGVATASDTLLVAPKVSILI